MFIKLFPPTFYGINNTYKIKRFSTFCRIGGLGYRGLSSITHRHSLTTKRRWAIWCKSMLPIDWWLGCGKPLNPYINGLLVSYIRDQLKPKQLKVVPEEFFSQPGMAHFNEWSLTRSWMVQWLASVRWYCETALNPVVSIQSLIDTAPIVQDHWNLRRRDESLFRFGFQWKCYDMLRDSRYVMPGILGTGRNDSNNKWLLGGFAGTSFLILVLLGVWNNLEQGLEFLFILGLLIYMVRFQTRVYLLLVLFLFLFCLRRVASLLCHKASSGSGSQVTLSQYQWILLEIPYIRKGLEQ